MSSWSSRGHRPKVIGGFMSDREKIENEATFDEEDIEELAARMRASFDIRDRKYGFPSRTYEKCFVGKEAVGKLIEEGVAIGEEDAIHIGKHDAERWIFSSRPSRARL